MRCEQVGQIVSSVPFASFGRPTGSCEEGWRPDSRCDAAGAADLARATCIGKAECSLWVNAAAFAPLPACNASLLWLAVEYECSPSHG
eukprot:4427669-Prymnesium_polylepis.2